MKPVKLQHSKSKIDKAGEVLRKNYHRDIQSSLEIISNWRAYHLASQEAFAKTLRARVKNVGEESNTIVAQRLKRMSSIVLELQAHKTMRLSAMQDIGGLRAIVDNMDHVNKLVDIYKTSKTKHQLFSLDDYISHPAKDGYRSIHLVYKLKKTPSLFIEIQIRTHLQHIWATAVEIFGTLKNSSFKLGHGEKKWLKFFELLSAVFAIKEKTVVGNPYSKLKRETLLEKTKKIMRTLKAIEELSMYSTIYKTIMEKGEKKGRKGQYFLIILNSKDNRITVKKFSINQTKDAIHSYLTEEKKFFNDININVVLLKPGNIKKIKESYPNYFMDTQTLVRYLSQIMTDNFF